MPLQSLHNLLGNEATVNSSAVFVYTTTPSAPFGETLVKDDSEENGTAEIWQMETRPGAGSALVGFVESIAYTSKGAHSIEVEEIETASVPSKRTTRSNSTISKKVKTTSSIPTSQKPITVLSSPASLLSLVPSLLALPYSAIRPSLAVHVSAQTSVMEKDSEGEVSLVQVPDLGNFFEAIKSLEQGGWTGAVVLNESATEAAIIGTGVAQAITGAGFDLINVFDGLTAGRPLSHLDATTIDSVKGESLEKILSTSVEHFTYSGPATATQILVLPASTYSACAKAALAALTNGSDDVGIVTVRVVKPWNSAAFLAALPTSTTTLHIFAEAALDEDVAETGPFYESILSTLLAPPVFKLKLRSLPIPSTLVPTVQDWAARILSIASPDASMPPVLKSILPEQSKFAVFWDLDSTSGQTELVASNLALAFSEGSTGVESTVETRYDNFKQGGLQQSLLLLEPTTAVSKEFLLSATAATALPSLLFLSSPAAVFKAYAPISISTAGPETRIVLSAKWTVDEVTEKIPESARNALAAISTGEGKLYVVDTDKLAADHKVQAADIAEIVFWSSYLPVTLPLADMATILAATSSFAKMEIKKLSTIIASVRASIAHVKIGANWSEVAVVEAGSEVAALSNVIVPTAAGPNPDRTFVDPVARVAGDSKSSWFSVAQRLLFPEAFKLSNVLEEKMRPDLPEKNYLVTVTENRRLTPGNYDRNVFHLEMSTVGTGLKYTVGEALGIHGWNDDTEVKEFIEWYGLDAEAVVEFPCKEDLFGKVEQRTIFQIFQQTLDIFGKPGKSFYETLSKYATNKDHERALRFIACADGHATFKKMSEVDTLTYADVMRMFPSAKPSIEVLLQEIEEIKPRHYSIASSQNFVGDSVHLLVVTVEWEDTKGATRYGQCTRYLNNLKAGQQVMVSVKPSVMKLPPRDTQPIIMAGLGTGAAPFRAFIQERAWQKSQGLEVGPALYYFGSRHRSKEYLYGEEIEAYMSEGVLTHTGLAFSRDTDKKVYIQHKMNEDAELLATMLEDGVFYLCGPTWPVPDVHAALIKSFVGRGKTVEAAHAYIEELKEEERYVLEVY